MLRLSPPLRDAVQDLQDAIDSSRTVAGVSLQAAQPRLVAAYQAYLDTYGGGVPCSPIALSAVEVSALHSSYDALRARQALVPIREDIFASVWEELDGFCPLCGVDQATTLDHFAPKDSYAEFSIFAPNLVPCCPTCNKDKGHESGNSVREIPFLHAYFDDLPDDPLVAAFVFVDDQLEAVYVEFMVGTPAGCEPAILDKIQNQITRLNLFQKMRRVAHSELVSIAGACELFHSIGGADLVATYCADIEARVTDQLGTNHWRAVLYRAAGHSADFCSGGFQYLRPRQRSRSPVEVLASEDALVQERDF